MKQHKGVNQIDQETWQLLSASDPSFRIVYLFPHARQDLSAASRFGWYTPGILDAADPVMQACALPADIREANTSQTGVLYQRLTGSIWPRLMPIEIDSLEAALEHLLPTPFVVCVTTSASVADKVDEILEKSSTPVLHVSTARRPSRVPPAGLDNERIGKYVRQVLEALASKPETQWLARESRRLLSASPRRKIRKHPLPRGGHNLTRPNELALAAFGFNLLSTKYVVQKGGSAGDLCAETYVERICRSADAVEGERARLTVELNPHLIDHRAVLTVHSFYSGLYRSWKELVERTPSELRASVRRTLAMILRAQSYFHEISLDGDNGPDPRQIGATLSRLVGADMRAYTAGLSMLSSATLCPVLRLEPKLNAVRADAAELARCVRAHKIHHAWKQARMMRLLGQRMRSFVHPEFLKRIDAKEAGPIEGMKLITDLPLELMPSEGIPLGLRFDVSRVSPVPGNMFWQLCNLPPLRVSKERFNDVLIVRSFEAGDPVRRVLETALTAFSGDLAFRSLKYRFVDVKTPQQFVDAVNAFDGALMIFDGHGCYDVSLGIGRLIVGKTALDTWALTQECRLPPVVMFSACDTQPIEGSHGSVGTAAFALGAHAVLGTMLPVHAARAATMMGRMLFRIDQFVPLARKALPVLTWRHVVSGMLRMSHTTEAMRELNHRAELGLQNEAFSRVQLIANEHINSWSPAWYSAFLEALGEEAGRSAAEIQGLLTKHVGLTDAMKYVQLGNPERIIIH